MPIKFTQDKGWFIDRPSQEEKEALFEIGKMMVIQGLAGVYTNERYASWLEQRKIEQMFQA